MLKRVLVVACAAFAMLGILAPPVLAQDDPLRGTTVTIRNTFERDDDGEEDFGEPATATVGALIEFFPYGPYNVDVSSTEITFAWDSDPQWDEFERILEADFYDRYYIDLEGVTIDSARADGNANLVPNVTVLDGNSLVVEFTEGMKVSDGQIASISLQVSASDGSEEESEEAPAEQEAAPEESREEASEEPKEEPKEEKEEEASRESASTSSSESLPRTGPDAEVFGAGAIGLLSLGAALVVARRRAARETLSL